MSDQPSSSKYALLDFGKHETTGPQHVNNSNSELGYQSNICGNNNTVSVAIHNSLPLEQFTELDVPRPSSVFEGREDAIERLDQLFFVERKRKVVVSGLAGYGKTELAKQYAQHAMKNGNVKRAFWVAAETTDNLEHKYEKLKKSFRTFVNDITLYVLDNAETLRSVSKYLPPDTANFLVLVTSQYSRWGDDVASVELKPVSRETSFLIFQEILGDARYERVDKSQIGEIIESVSDIPLGLVVIAGHLRDQMEIDNFNMDNFSKMLSSEMLDKGIEASVDSSYSKTISAAIFGMVDKMTSWPDAKEEVNEITNMLLCVCAHLDPDRIHIGEVKEILDMRGESDRGLIDSSVHIVKKFSFFENYKEYYFGKESNTCFKLHRMCQDILRRYYGEKFKKEEIKIDCYSKCLEWALQDKNISSIHRAAIFRHADENKTVVIKMIHKYYNFDFTVVLHINLQSPLYRNLKNILQSLAGFGCVECLTSFLNDIHETNRKKILHETRLLSGAAGATQGRPYDTVRFLLEVGSDVHALDDDGETALHGAAKVGHADVVKLLLEGGSDVRAVDSYVKTALHRAARWGHADVVKLLLEGGSDVRAVVGYGRDELSLAQPRNGYTEAVKRWLEGGCNDRDKFYYRWTPLHLAARWGHEDVVKLLLEGGSDVRAVDNGGETALHGAARGGHAGIVKLLLEGGSDVRAVDNGGETALHGAARGGHAGIVKLLLEGGSDVRAVAGDGWTALHGAAEFGHADVVELLLEGGSDVRAVIRRGRTALHEAAWGGRVDIIKLLLVHGADANARDQDGCTAWDLATKMENAEVARVLQELGH